MWEYAANIYKVVDGDTVYGTVDLGFGIFARQKFRFVAIDTPEIFRPSCDAEKQHGFEAKKFVEKCLLNKTVFIKSYKNKTGKYGRYLCDISFKDENDEQKNIIMALKENGFEKRENYDELE